MMPILMSRREAGAGYREDAVDQVPPPAFSEIDPLFQTRTRIAAEDAGGYDDGLQRSDSSSSRPSDNLARQVTAPARLAEPPPTRASFTVAGKELTKPLITLAAVRAHLQLLASFRQLRTDLFNYRQPELDAAGITDDDRWSIFLVKAHHRFEAWITSRTIEPEYYDLPMTDFLFIWYTYLVHPREYQEDNGQEAVSHGFDVIKAAQNVDPETNRHRALADDATPRLNYEQHVGLSLDIDFHLVPDAPMNEFDHVQPVSCPACQTVQYPPFFSLVDPQRGYAHKNWRSECPNCGLVVTREKLSVGRFALNLLLYIKNKIYLCGTQLHPATGRPDGFFAATLNNGLTTELRRICEGCETSAEIGERLDWKWANVERHLRNSALGSPLPRRVTGILAAYAQPMFSVDLVDRAKRQMLFIDQLHSLGWLERSFYETDASRLQRAIARYHQYLDVCAANRSLKQVYPTTVDINMVMQAHCLLARQYKSSCILVLGMMPNNNELLTQRELVAGFEKIGKLFKSRFKQPYISCGCEKALISKLSLSGAINFPGKDVCQIDDVLRVLAISEGTPVKLAPFSSNSASTHPCGHTMIIEGAGLKKPGKGKLSADQHRNDVVDPSQLWYSLLSQRSLYGYGDDRLSVAR